jgi:hypothetical protein
MFCILQSTVWGGFYLYFVNTDQSQAIDTSQCSRHSYCDLIVSHYVFWGFSFLGLGAGISLAVN